MSHSYDVKGNTSGTFPGQSSVNTLANAPNGDVHLLVTFEILTDNPRTDGGDGDISPATFTVPGADRALADDREPTGSREPTDDRGSTDDRDAPGGPDAPENHDAMSDLDGVEDRDPFGEPVMRPGTSNAEHVDPEFSEAVDVESLVSYLGLDFVEHELFAEQFLPDTDEVVYTSRGIGGYQLLCVYSVDRGLLLVVDEDEAIQPLVGHARSLLTET